MVRYALVFAFCGVTHFRYLELIICSSTEIAELEANTVNNDSPTWTYESTSLSILFLVGMVCTADWEYPQESLTRLEKSNILALCQKGTLLNYLRKHHCHFLKILIFEKFEKKSKDEFFSYIDFIKLIWNLANSTSWDRNTLLR